MMLARSSVIRAGWALPYLLVVVTPLVAVVAAVDPTTLRETMTNPRYLRLLTNSALVATVAAVTAAALGLVLSLVTEQLSFPGRRLVRTLTPGPLLIPPTLTVVAWVFVLGPALARDLLYNTVAAGVLLGSGLMPLVAVPTSLALARLDPRLLEAARMTRPVHSASLRLTLGLVRTPMLGGALLTFALAATEHAALSFVFLDTAAGEVATRMGGEFDAAGAAAAALPLCILAGLAALAERLLDRRGPAAALDPGGDAPLPRPRVITMPLRGLAFLAGILALTPGLLLPVIYLLWMSLSSAGAWTRAWDVGGEPLLRSLTLGAGAASLALVVCVPLAAALYQRRGMVVSLTETVALLPLAAAGAVVGTGLIAIWNHPAPGWLPAWASPAELVYDRLGVLVHATVARFAPLALLVLLAATRRISSDQLDAARLCGLGLTRRAIHVALPHCWQALLGAWLLVFALAAGEISATALVMPPGRETLPLTLFNLLHFGRDADVAAMSLLLVGAVLLPLIIALPLWRHLWRQDTASIKETGA